VSPESFVFPCCPTNQIQLYIPQKWIHGRFVKPTIVVHPSLNLRSEHLRKVREVLITPKVYFPTPDFFAYSVCRIITDCGCKVDEGFTVFILR
jgi:hypothetical protein